MQGNAKISFLSEHGILLVKELWLFLWELCHSIINTAQHMIAWQLNRTHCLADIHTVHTTSETKFLTN